MQKGSNEQFLNFITQSGAPQPTCSRPWGGYSWARSCPWTPQSDRPGRSGVLGKACDWAHLLGGEWPEKSKVWWCTGEKSWEALTQRKNEFMLLSINLLSYKMRVDKKIKWDWYEHNQRVPQQCIPGMPGIGTPQHFTKCRILIVFTRIPGRGKKHVLILAGYHSELGTWPCFPGTTYRGDRQVQEAWTLGAGEQRWVRTKYGGGGMGREGGKREREEETDQQFPRTEKFNEWERDILVRGFPCEVCETLLSHHYQETSLIICSILQSCFFEMTQFRLGCMWLQSYSGEINSVQDSYPSTGTASLCSIFFVLPVLSEQDKTP